MITRTEEFSILAVVIEKRFREMDLVTPACYRDVVFVWLLRGFQRECHDAHFETRKEKI
jgi:hypothetical protein